MTGHLIAPVWAIDALLLDHYENCTDCQGDGDVCRQVYVTQRALGNRVIPSMPVRIGDLLGGVVADLVAREDDRGGQTV